MSLPLFSPFLCIFAFLSIHLSISSQLCFSSLCIFVSLAPPVCLSLSFSLYIFYIIYMCLCWCVPVLYIVKFKFCVLSLSIWCEQNVLRSDVAPSKVDGAKIFFRIFLFWKLNLFCLKFQEIKCNNYCYAKLLRYYSFKVVIKTDIIKSKWKHYYFIIRNIIINITV